jgi:hypothetical protein
MKGFANLAERARVGPSLSFEAAQAVYDERYQRYIRSPIFGDELPTCTEDDVILVRQCLVGIHSGMKELAGRLARAMFEGMDPSDGEIQWASPGSPATAIGPSVPMCHDGASSKQQATERADSPANGDLVGAASGSDGYKVTRPLARRHDDLTETQKNILAGAKFLKTFDRSRGRPLPMILEAGGIKASPDSRNIRNAVDGLKGRGLMDAARGTNGGHWITPDGLEVIGE